MIHVLIVEDDPLIAEAHSTYLTKIDEFRVAGVAGTARDGMRIAVDASSTDMPIDLVLLDLGLPDRSGIALAGALSGLRPAPDIIAITAERDLDMVRAAVSHGALAYLLKPFTFAAFRERMERYRKYREALPSGTNAVSQGEVDRALAVMRIAADKAAAQPGASETTTEDIARALRNSPDGLTADAVAKLTGVSRVTAWRYLERLADDGIASRSNEYKKVGRPTIRYRWN